MKRSRHPILKDIGHLALLSVVGAGLCACNHEAGTQSVPTQASQTPQVFEVTDQIRARLAQADAADGHNDHVIEKCVTCNLMMPGKPAFTSVAGDYRVQLCSAGCKALFEKDPAKALLALPATGR